MAASVSRAGAVVLGLIAPGLLNADEVPPPAYQLAARQAQIPSMLLYAVALQESGLRTGGRIVPWPWSLNVAGRSQRYKDQRAACHGLRQALKTHSAMQIDVGLGQLNVGYQGPRVRQPCELLEPYRNLRLTATILREQYQSEENWLMAAGRYHRPAGGQAAIRYRRAVGRYLMQLTAGGPS